MYIYVYSIYGSDALDMFQVRGVRSVQPRAADAQVPVGGLRRRRRMDAKIISERSSIQTRGKGRVGQIPTGH